MPLAAGKFHPYAFPDARRLHVPTSVIVGHPTLFAARTGDIVAVLRLDDDDVLPFLDVIGDVEGKADISPRMRARKTTVYPNLCRIIHAVEVEKAPLCNLRFVQRYAAPIPDVVAGFFPTDPARRALISERNKNIVLFFKALKIFSVFALVALVESKIPLSVEIEPLAAHKLRTGIMLNVTFCMIHCDLSFLPS